MRNCLCFPPRHAAPRAQPIDFRANSPDTLMAYALRPRIRGSGGHPCEQPAVIGIDVFCLDIERAKGRLRWEPTIALEAGLAWTVSYLKTAAITHTSQEACTSR